MKKRPFLIHSLILILLLNTSGCSSKLKKMLSSKKTPVKVRPTYYCQSKFDEGERDFHFYTHDQKLSQSFLEVSKKNSLSDNEAFTLWLLMNSMAAPHSLHPNARLQLYIINPKKSSKKHSFSIQSFDTRSSQGGLSILINKLIQKKRLSRLIRLANNHTPKHLLMTEQFFRFLSNHKSQITLDSELWKKYTLSNDIIPISERFERSPYPRKLKRNLKKKSFSNQAIKTTSTLMALNQSTCPLYNKRPAKEEKSLATHIALKTPSGRTYLLFSSVSEAKILDNQIKAKASEQGVPVCFFEHENQILVSSSLEGEKKEKILKFTLQEYFVKNMQHGSIVQMLDSPRFVKAKHTNKILFESFRADQDFQSKLHKFKSPLFHSNGLGIVNATKIDGQQSIYYFDSRDKTRYFCQSSK
ncbi:MAG: hypothetical protein ACPGJV_14705 [Bacteriovoracaceae bacterium]